jgi:hypothetical protein
MKFLKFFIITLSITSFLSTSVLSKSFSLCAESHSERINIDKKSEIENHPCHSSAKKEKGKNLCFECDCYLTQLLYNEMFHISTLDISKFSFEFIIKYYSINKKIKVPPPKIIS